MTELKSINQQRPTVLVISTGFHLYREYLLRQIVEEANVWLFTDAAPTWQIPYLNGYTLVNTLDAEAMAREALALAATRKIDGLICWDEIRMVPTSRVAAALGLPGGETDAYARCRDKHETRQALAAAAVPQPESVLVADIGQAVATAARIGYPVIVKPRGLGGSYGVTLVNDEAELTAAMQHVDQHCELLAGSGYTRYESSVLIEEYMTGEEVSVDVAWVDGRMHPLFVARKETGFFPHFEEIGHVVHGHDPLLEDAEFLAVLEGAHRAVGFRNGITHTELMLTAKGPKIIEINSRLGGDMIPYIGGISSGIRAGAVAVAVACGRAPDVARTRQRTAAVRFLYPDGDCVVQALAVDRDALPENVDDVCLLVEPGHTLYFPRVSGRYAFLTAYGDSEAACKAALDQAAAAVRFEAEPLAEAAEAV
ncbi:ATP-grasp domain-containing protein [Chromobacterium subtsugae]|uniref:ATP-grasp domain-containing protein n=1 Tax=Chromobacterium subtsugae TaxID=251747 RepID=UPI000640F150|nr:ATP-grasp domain-containing protein [Chromobacterium subtsugae]